MASSECAKPPATLVAYRDGWAHGRPLNIRCWRRRTSTPLRPQNRRRPPHTNRTHAQQVNGNEHGEVEERNSSDQNNHNGESSGPGVEADLEKPGHTVASEVVKAGSEDPHAHESQNNTSNGNTAQQNYTHFQNKRLCERWLDNLFMVLYEDLRVYTIWRTEMAQYRQQQLLYKKSSEEWEILGELAERLHHSEEAVEAYENCLQIKFSPKAMKGVLKLGEKRKQVRDVTAALIRLITWQYRWYSEFSPSLLYTIRKLIEEEGAVKIRSIVQGTSLPQHVLDLTHQYAALCAAFRSSGSDG